MDSVVSAGEVENMQQRKEKPRLGHLHLPCCIITAELAHGYINIDGKNTSSV